MRAWLRQHRQAFALAARKIGAQGSAALLNALVIGVALSLPAGGYALLSDLQAVMHRVAYAPQLSLYLRPDAPRAGAEALAARLKRDARVGEVRFVPREEALARLRESVLFWLESCPCDVTAGPGLVMEVAHDETRS